MKPKYQVPVDHLIKDQGDRFRFLRGRWWVIVDGYWSRDGRGFLEQEISGFVQAYAPELVARDMTQSDVNQICAFLARKLYTTALPGRNLSPDQDPKLLFMNPRPPEYLG